MRLRKLAFTLHRYLGLAVGLLLVIVGLTGSLLVFEPELDRALIHFQFGSIIPQTEQVAILSVIDTVRAAKLGWNVTGIDLPLSPDDAIRVSVATPAQASLQVLVNPYTGKVIGDRIQDFTFRNFFLNVHYTLAAGDIGIAIVGIAALLLFVLSLTGIMLWSGWRNLLNGFKIKWRGHIKRVNFDIHKVAGIFAAIFLALTGITGFGWNFYDRVEPIIYAITFTSKSIEPTSTVIPGKSTIALAEILQRANAILPQAKIAYINFPTSPTGVFQINKQFPEDREIYRSRVYFDRYTGAVLKVRNSRQLQLGDRVLDSFTPLHFGTFGGLPTRILYVFVGLAPTILMTTGFTMWRHRQRSLKLTIRQ